MVRVEFAAEEQDAVAEVFKAAESARAVVALSKNKAVKTDNLPKKGDGARCRCRTCDPYRVKVMLYH